MRTKTAMTSIGIANMVIPNKAIRTSKIRLIMTVSPQNDKQQRSPCCLRLPGRRTNL